MFIYIYIYIYIYIHIYIGRGMLPNAGRIHLVKMLMLLGH